MRILILSDFYPPVLGGLELQVQLLARGLARRGHTVSVATLSLDAPEVSCDEGVTVHRVNGWNRALAPIYKDRQRPFHPTIPDPGVVRSLRRLVQATRPQAVSAHSWIVYSFLPLKRWSGVRLSMMMHDYALVCPKKTFVHHGRACTGPAYSKCVACATSQYGALGSVGLTTGLSLSSSLLAREVDQFIANSNSVADVSLWRARRERAEVAVTPPFLPESAFGTALHPRPAFVPERGDFLLFAGSLSRDKGADVLLEAYGMLSPAIPLVLVGMTREETPISLPPGVASVGRVSHEDVLAALQHCTIALVPSRTEAFGLTAAEAMAAGRPVIASAVGGLRDTVVDGETALLVPPGSPVALRDAIAHLLAHPAERERMGEAGRERSWRFAESRILPEMEQLIVG